MQTPGADMRCGKVCVLEIVRPGMEDSESAKKQENTGIGPAGACRGESAFTRHESAATQFSCATAGRTKNQPAAVGNGHGPRSIVSGLLFTMNSATPTCRAVSRGKRAHDDTMTSRFASGSVLALADFREHLPRRAACKPDRFRHLRHVRAQKRVCRLFRAH